MIRLNKTRSEWHLILCFILIYIASLSYTYGQGELRFQNYTLKDGFPHVGTYFQNSILKDTEGFVWFATINGLCRFDGEFFKNYKHNPNQPNSISTNLLSVLSEDDHGRIWIGTAFNGIILFDKEKELFFDLPSSPSDLFDAHIFFIEKDRDGNMWFGGEHGVEYWEKETGQIIRLNTPFENAYGFLQQSDGTIWIGDNIGLYKKRPNQIDFEHIPIPGGGIIDFVELANGNFWIIATNSFWEFDPQEGTFTDQKKEWGFNAHGFVEGLNDEIWLLSNNDIIRYNQNTGRRDLYAHNPDDPLSLPASGIVDLLVDSVGNLFVQTNYEGISLAHTQSNPFEVLPNITSREFIGLDDHRVLMRDLKQGGIIYDTDKKEISSEKIPTGPGVIYLPSLALRGDSLLWIWHPDKIQSYHLKTGILTTAPKNSAHSLYVNLDQSGRVWNGLSYLDEEENKWINLYPELQKKIPGLENVEFTYAYIAFDEKNRLWAFIEKYPKILRYDLTTRQAKVYPFFGLPDASKKGSLFIRDFNGFAMYSPKQDSFLFFTETKGLQHSCVYQIHEDGNGSIWLNTPKGIQKFDRTTETFTDIDHEDGFPVNDKSLVLGGGIDQDGYLYYDLNQKDVFRFHPDSLHLNRESASVYLLDFFLNLQAITPGDSSLLSKNLRFTKNLKLRYDQADFGFSFTMPAFYKSEQIEYYYRLQPYQQKWQSNGTSNILHYTNISPGNYTFEVKAKTASGMWSTNIATVQINISSPWWETVWARALFFGLIISVVFAIWKYELNRRLAKSEALRLQELDRLKTKLYTNITHEFRTPLTVIMGITDQIKDQQQERNLIRRNSKNLLRLINQLLDLSKLDSGSMSQDLVQGDIVNYLRYLTESFHSMALERKIDLKFNSEMNELIMDFDEVKIQHIVYNLLSNALKFTLADGQVVLNTRVHEKNGRPYLQLKVSDTGIGIKDEDKKQIFNRFYQADGSSTRKGEGTGIGLALTKELIEMMGGSIHVVSSWGEGSHFTLLLPVNKSSTIKPLNTQFETGYSKTGFIGRTVNQTKASETKGPEGSPADKIQILLIEDNRDVAVYVETLLKTDYHVLIARDGQEGIEMAIQTIPDLIISDVMMPEKDGYEVCHALKTDERTSHIPIILLTAKAEQKDKVFGLKQGADAYLMKPFDKAELMVRLEKLLELRKTLQEKYSSMEVLDTVLEKSQTPTLEDVFLQKVRAVIDDRIDDAELSIPEICAVLHLSNMQVYRKIKALTGKTPSLFIRSYRLHKAMDLLKTTNQSISEVAYDTGFTTPAYFSRAFKEEFGKPPSFFRK